MANTAAKIWSYANASIAGFVLLWCFSAWMFMIYSLFYSKKERTFQLLLLHICTGSAFGFSSYIFMHFFIVDSVANENIWVDMIRNQDILWLYIAALIGFSTAPLPVLFAKDITNDTGDYKKTKWGHILLIISWTVCTYYIYLFKSDDYVSKDIPYIK